jgi:DNA modification methylase
MAVEGATVVDWCAGSGTTGVAALELGMSPILFEREPSAHSLIEARCAQAQSAIDNQKKENKNG